ncbi:hypothetical protein L4D09_16305 [Photobacterium makurazakiensis]|uniref:hypothetical protein n=1 Tax=Photobacterium makurazakiensis TaxID=2910234 RepID=UPI003D0DAE09
MRPASFVRTCAPRSPSRLRTTSHAPVFKAKKTTASVEVLSTNPVKKTLTPSTRLCGDEQAA